jgi:LysR family hydrogen peroxide-inducible transcriptional activator
MELHQLRYFVAVAQAGNFSRAAERCHVSQPSLSQQILKLEKRLGQPLFHRLGRRAVLTDAGRLLLERATVILATLEDAEARLRATSDPEGGRLAIGVIPTIAPYLLPRTLEGFVRRFPKVEMVVREDLTAHLVPAVVEGELDLAIVALPVVDEHLEFESLLVEPLWLTLSPGHPLTRRKRIGLEDLAEERFILLNEMHCLGEQILNFCRAHECQPQIACRSAQIGTIQALIALGQGISLLPEMARRADRGGRLIYRALSGDSPQRTVAAVWHRHHYHGPLVDQFLVELRRWSAEQQLSEEGPVSAVDPTVDQ